ncbi:hypothetical protein B0A55_07935 [Friedmanniomyces simplex]|uniref:Uncharacterized protein n=1 Tax=Friedmanniomyces simplex TaxID=329884 RepID=A0A4U0XJA8_9PEZI|nr:hypothetical protein B0A55_07935 [Friedmanniomyces simplex]
MELVATWTKLTQSEPFKRSSVCASDSGSTTYVFGGELTPRQPRDNNVYKIQVNVGKSILFTGCGLPVTNDRAGVETIAASATAPSSRVGAATTSLNGRVYMFPGQLDP